MSKDLSLTTLSPDHLPALSALWRDPEVIRYTSIQTPCTPEDSRDRLELLLSNQDHTAPTLFAVMTQGRCIGMAGCPPVNRATGEFGFFYQLARSAWGRGLGRRAADLVVAEMRRSHPAALLYADVVVNNFASVKILEGLGFSFHRRNEAAFCRDGARLDVLEYRLQL